MSDSPAGSTGSSVGAEDVELRFGAGLADAQASWQVSSSEVVHETGRVISVRRDQVVPPAGGEPFVRDVVVHPGAVGVVALDENHRMLLVRQYRHPVGYRLLEPPAGLLDVQGEAYRLGAERELWEEAATKAADWRVLVDAFTSPGLTNEAVRIFLARDLSAADESYDRLHEEADMETVWAPLEDVVKAVLSGDLHNPILVMGALAAWTALNGEGFEALRPADSPWPAKDR
ncbi:NUDIX hydrolase [Kribbella flavida DSM 17836]|uniref:NUDIX hydrolase n=1 Tax=Kribbella flavida (strain DSM 17836 / JCM 10339 / NBRC 14399) TaxID=479435 RepID=D2PM56_KRIFD|nr:NUDIX hydrolase [Kribbella flavida]ADB34424.1 NUDIX hydrolase [Kribbella flavida DSM 17836]